MFGRTTFAILSCLLVFSISGAQTQSPLGQTASPETTRVLVLAGVDKFGRLLVVLDVDRDRISDKMFMFTGQERFKNPWSIHLDSARVVWTIDTLKVESHDDSFVALLAVEGAELPAVTGSKRAYDFQDAFIDGQGMEFVTNSAEQTMESLNFEVIESWPLQFHHDLLQAPTPAAAP